jgi:hypothetical protein
VQRHLAAKGLKVATGTIADATIVSATSSTKNMARDPEMHQMKKGNQWYFGMKAHIGVESCSKLIRRRIKPSGPSRASRNSTRPDSRRCTSPCSGCFAEGSSRSRGPERNVGGGASAAQGGSATLQKPSLPPQ